MKACSPGVVPSSCSSSSLPWDSDARQASSASNVGLPHSSFRCTTSTSSSSLSPVGCPLSLSVTVSNPSFFRIAHRRRKHSSSRRGVFVVRGSSSTFEVEEQRESHGFQIAESASREQEEPVVKGRVAWSADGKAKILWAGRKQQDNISELHEGHQSNRIGPQHGPPLPSAGGQKNSSSIAKHQGASAGECNNSISVTSHQGAFAGEHNSPISITKQEGAFAASHRFPERSSFPARKQTERCDPSSVSRLRIELPASKQAAEPDTIRPPTFSVVGSDTASSRNETGEENSQTGSVFTSRLEEILQKFRNRPKWRGKSFEDEGAAVTRESSNFKRREMNGSKADNVQEPVKKGITNSSYEGFIHKIPTENKDANDNFFGLRRDPHGERRSTTGQTNARGHTKESTNFKGREMNGSKVDNVQEPLKKGFRSSSYEGFIHKIKFPTENKDANGSFFGPQRYPHGERRSITGQMNARDRHTSDQFNGSPTTSWEAQRVGLPAPKIHSPVGKGSSTFLGRQAVKTGSSKYYPKNASWESKAGAWGTATEKPETKRERRMRTVSQIPDAQKHARCQSDIDAEGDADIISPFNSDFKDEDSRSVQNEETVGQMPDSSVGIRTHRSEPLVKEGKASWHSYPTSNLPFEFQYSYSEAPNAPIVRYREKPFSPFGPETLPRPWTGGRPLEKSKKNLPVFDSFNPPPKGKKGIKYVQDPGPYPQGKGPKPARSRDEILGEPLTTEEIVQLVDGCQNENRQLNLGRDGLTHNMLDLIHSHWKRRRVVKIRCLGVPTLDMDNVCFHLEDKTGGKIIFRAGGVVYLFRGRNYNYKDRPHIPLMLWKPPTPVYPKLIRRAPEGLTIEEADQLRQLGQKLEPLCSLGKNGVYLTLVSDVRAAFKIDKVVRIDCRGLNPSDYKKIGAKLKDLVPCVLLSFDDEQILIWKGKETGSIHVGALNGKEAAEGSTQESSVPQAESASIGMNDLRVEACADIPMNGNGSTQESSVPQLGSASIGMNDLRVEACADIPMNGNESCLAIINTQSLSSLEEFNSYSLSATLSLSMMRVRMCFCLMMALQPLRCL